MNSHLHTILYPRREPTEELVGLALKNIQRFAPYGSHLIFQLRGPGRFSVLVADQAQPNLHLLDYQIAMVLYGLGIRVHREGGLVSLEPERNVKNIHPNSWLMIELGRRVYDSAIGFHFASVSVTDPWMMGNEWLDPHTLAV